MDKQELLDRAKAGDFEAQWSLIETTDPQTNTDPLASRKSTLKLHPAERTQRPEIQRELGRADATLRAVFKDLVTSQRPWPLYLHGAIGSGKTAAGLALLDHVGGLFFDCEELADLVAAGRFPELAESIMRAPLVVLDELCCREKLTDLHYVAVKRLIDLRERAGCRLIAISNAAPERLATAYDARIADRLLCGVVFDLGKKQVQRLSNTESRRFTG